MLFHIQNTSEYNNNVKHSKIGSLEKSSWSEDKFGNTKFIKWEYDPKLRVNDTTIINSSRNRSSNKSVKSKVKFIRNQSADQTSSNKISLLSRANKGTSSVELELKEKEPVINDDEIIMLFKARWKDLGFSINFDQLDRFKKYITRKSYNGNLRLKNLGLSDNTVKALIDVVHSNPKIK